MAKKTMGLGKARNVVFSALGILFACADTAPAELSTIDFKRPSAARSPPMTTEASSSYHRAIGKFSLHPLREDSLAFLADQEINWVESGSPGLIETRATQGQVDRWISEGWFEEQTTRSRIFPDSDWCRVVPTKDSSDFLWDYDDIVKYARSLESPLVPGSPQKIRTEFLGTTLEKRKLIAVKFGPSEFGENPSPLPKTIPTIYLVATQHAREWGAAGTAVGLMRELAATLNDPAYRPILYAALKRVSVVIVPVANPDGYEYTRTTNRGWRGNRNLANCFGGVDLNRNHAATWRVPARSEDPFCSFNPEVYCGPSAASEEETRMVDLLLGGSYFADANHPREGVFTLDLHTYSDLLVYPSAFKLESDANGPACNMGSRFGDDQYCLSPDFQALRSVFGDTTDHLNNPAPRFFDEVYGVPFRRGHAKNIFYPSSGTVTDQAAYGGVRMFSATVELFSGTVDFGIECEPNSEELFSGAVRRMVDVVEQLSLSAPVAKPNRNEPFAETWLTSKIGKYASAYVAREYSSAVPGGNGTRHLAARPQLLWPVWEPFSRGNTFSASTASNATVLSRQRKAAFYEMFSAGMLELTRNPLQLPCSVEGSISQGSATAINPECSPTQTVIELCDQNRFWNNSWAMNRGVRGGSDDCWWYNPQNSGVMEIPSYPVSDRDARCVLSFSVESPSLVVQRVLSPPLSGSETVLSRGEPQPYGHSGSFEGISTHFFEARSNLSSMQTDAFVIYATGPTVKLFEPAVYCTTEKF